MASTIIVIEDGSAGDAEIKGHGAEGPVTYDQCQCCAVRARVRVIHRCMRRRPRLRNDIAVSGADDNHILMSRTVTNDVDGYNEY